MGRESPLVDASASLAHRVSQRLIRHAARHAPPALASRLEEEWLADFLSRPSTAARLRFALGCCWAARVIAAEQSIPTLQPATSGAGAKSMFAFAQHNLGLASRRTLALGLVAGLHIAVFYAFMVGLAGSFTQVMRTPLQNTEIHEVRPRDNPLPLPPNLDPFKFYAPPPEPIPTAAVEDTAAIPTDQPPIDTEADGGAASPPPAHVVQQVQGGPGAGFPNPDDYYPTLARRLEEQGIATVRVCVDATGRLTSDPTTVIGTGSVRLDDGALKLARAGSGHYRASTEDGKPVNSCYPLRIRFQMKNQ